jgi:hypothetical protein
VAGYENKQSLKWVELKLHPSYDSVACTGTELPVTHFIRSAVSQLQDNPVTLCLRASSLHRLRIYRNDYAKR